MSEEEIPDPVLASYEIVEDPPSPPKQFGHRVVSLFNIAKTKIDGDQTGKSQVTQAKPAKPEKKENGGVGLSK